VSAFYRASRIKHGTVSGARCIGHVLARGRHGFEAFDADDNSIGIYAKQTEAANALADAANALELLEAQP